MPYRQYFGHIKAALTGCNPCTKFGIDQVKGSKDIEQTTQWTEKGGVTLTFEHVTWKSIGIIYSLKAIPAPNLVLIKWRGQKIWSGQHSGLRRVVWPWLLNMWPENQKGSSTFWVQPLHQVWYWSSEGVKRYWADNSVGWKELFDLDLWTCDLKINRDHLLIDGNPCTKFGIDQVKGSKDMERTTQWAEKSGLTLTFEHMTWKLIGIIYSLEAIPASSLVLIKWRGQKILSGQHLVYRPTDRPTDSCKTICPLFQGGHNYLLLYPIIHFK